MDQIDYNTIYIKFKDGVDQETRKQIIDDIKDAFVVWWGFSVITDEAESDRFSTTKGLCLIGSTGFPRIRSLKTRNSKFHVCSNFLSYDFGID